MKRVTGLGGIFFKVADPEKSKNWYHEHLGLPTDLYGATFKWREMDAPDKIAHTQWSVFDSKTKYMDPAQKDCMVNYRVHNLEALLKQLAKEGVEIVGAMETYDYGKFAWILDPDGYKIELWEPLDTTGF